MNLTSGQTSGMQRVVLMRSTVSLSFATRTRGKENVPRVFWESWYPGELMSGSTCGETVLNELLDQWLLHRESVSKLSKCWSSRYNQSRKRNIANFDSALFSHPITKKQNKTKLYLSLILPPNNPIFEFCFPRLLIHNLQLCFICHTCRKPLIC